MAMAKPTIVTQKVLQEAASNGPLNSAICCAICQGLGKMNSGMAKACTTTCHRISSATTSNSGAQRSTWR
jgi:hypothetical protein